MNSLTKTTLLTAALSLSSVLSHAQSTERESYDEVDVIYDLIINADIEDLTLDNLNRALIEVAENPGLNPRDGLIDRDRPFGFDINRRNGLKAGSDSHLFIRDRIDKGFGTVMEILPGLKHGFFIEDSSSGESYFIIVVIVKDEDLKEIFPPAIYLTEEDRANDISGFVSANDGSNNYYTWISESEAEIPGAKEARAYEKATEVWVKKSTEDDDSNERTFWGGSDQESPGQGPLNEDRPLNWGSLFDTIRIDPEFIGGSGDDLEKGPTPRNQGFGTIRMADEERFGDSKLHYYNDGVRGELELIMSGGGSVDPTWSDDDNEGAGGSWQPKGNPTGR